MKKIFLLAIISFFSITTLLAQKKLYLPDNSFKFKLAQFEMSLFKKEEIIGMFKDYFLVRTSINNSFTLLLVDSQGNIIQDFHGDWLLPENWEAENGLWLYQVIELQPGSSISRISILKYDFITKRIEIKAFEIRDYFEYSSIKPAINDNAFLCGNSHLDIVIFRFHNNDLKIINTDNRTILRYMYDGKRGLINVFEVILSASSRNAIKFYQFPISEEPDFNKHLKWLKNINALQMSEFYYYSQIRFISTEEFIILPGKFEDNQTIAVKYDFEGRITSKFNLPDVAGLQKDALKISFINNNWFLTHPHLSGLIYQAPSATSKEIILPGHSTMQMPENLRSDNFIFVDTSHIISTIDTRSLQLKKHEYQIPFRRKSYDLQKVKTLGDGSYWLFYNSPNGTYVKYNNKDEEVYRTPDSLYTAGDLNSFYQLNDTDVLIASYRHCNNCARTLDKYLSVNNKNEVSFLDPENFLGGNSIFYYDKTHKHFYTNKDSLVRYTLEAGLDHSFHIEKNIRVGSMLVSKQGNIFIGQAPSNYTIDSLYRLDSKGRVIWRKKYIFGEYNAYSQESAGFYGGLYPLFNKDSIIIWGSLLCGEGCYTSNNVAADENDKLVKLPYLGRRENNGPGYSFIDKYGVFTKNAQTFMAYNPIKNAIEKDENTTIKFITNYYEINELDILPNQDLLVVERNHLRKYSFKKTIWANIINLEKEKESYSHGFWGLTAADAINRQIKLDVFISDSSLAILKVIPENSEVAYIKNQTLFFTGKEGKVAVYAQSIKGGEPYISPEFTVQKGMPPFTIITEGGALYLNRPAAIQFESVEGIIFKIDSLQGSCILHDSKIVLTLPISTGCQMYYSWTGSDIYSAGSSATHLGVFEEIVLSDEEKEENTILFPNPLTHNILTIKSPKQHIALINITNMQGQKTQLIMFQSDTQGGRFVSYFEISKNFTPGTYIIELFDNQGVITKKEKLVINK